MISFIRKANEVMLKHKIVALLVAMISCGTASVSAQNEERVQWGLKLSVGAELPSKWHGDNGNVAMYRPGVGLAVGAVSNIYLGKNFYFEPGVSLFYTRYRYKDLFVMGDGGNFSEKDPTIHKYGVQIPLVAGYEISFSGRYGINVFTGPQLRYAFAGKTTFKNKELQKENEDILGLWNYQRRLDCSWKIGVGFPINSFNISVEADLGMTDLLKGDMSFRENRVGAAVTYYF